MDDAVKREDGPLQKPTVIPTPKVEMEVAKVEEMANAMAWALARIQALEADNARLRDALRPFADAWLTVSFPDEIECRLATVSKGKIIHMLVHEDGWLHASALRAAHLALHLDDTGGDGDEA